MLQHIGYIALLVRDYDEAISYFIEKLGFTVAEDTDLGGGKRWVLVAPPGSIETQLVLANAANVPMRWFNNRYASLKASATSRQDSVSSCANDGSERVRGNSTFSCASAGEWPAPHRVRCAIGAQIVVRAAANEMASSTIKMPPAGCEIWIDDAPCRASGCRQVAPIFRGIRLSRRRQRRGRQDRQS